MKTKLSIILALMPGLVLADTCVLQSKNVSQSAVVIQERADIRAEVVPALNGGRRCLVNFRARIGADWHTAFGEHTWPGDRPREEACAVALRRAEQSVQERVAASRVVSENVLICNDNPDLRTLRQNNPGTVGKLSQFRPHPDRPNNFWHNGAQCRYFIETNFVGSDIQTMQGIVCQIRQDEWVVVDKF